MPRTIGLFHATLNAVAPIQAEWRRAGGDFVFLNAVDEGLLQTVARRGLDASIEQRLGNTLQQLIDDGAEAVLLTCSSMTPLLPSLRRRLSRPIIGIDEAMIDEALRSGSHIGVVASLAGAAATTESLLLGAAAERGLHIGVEVALAEGAFDALRCGSFEAHDLAVRGQLLTLAPRCEVLVLAQVSLSRVFPWEGAPAVPILTSGPGAVRRTIEALESNPTS